MLLKKSFGAITKVCASENSRYGLACVYLSRGDDGRARVEATDGKILARIETTDLDHHGAPALIPAKSFAGVVKTGKNELVRLDEPTVNGKATFGRIATNHSGEPRFSLDDDYRTIDTGSSVVETIESRFPKTDDIIPSSAGRFIISFDPDCMIRLLEVFKANVEDDNRSVDFEIDVTDRGHCKPAKIVWKSADELTEITGVIMPMTLDR